MELIWPEELAEGDDKRGFEYSGDAEEIGEERSRKENIMESLMAGETVKSMAGGGRRMQQIPAGKRRQSFLLEGEGKATVIVCESNSFMGVFPFPILFIYLFILKSSFYNFKAYLVKIYIPYYYRSYHICFQNYIFKQVKIYIFCRRK